MRLWAKSALRLTQYSVPYNSLYTKPKWTSLSSLPSITNLLRQFTTEAPASLPEKPEKMNNKSNTNPLSKNTQSKTRNFCIVAHIDHGKSTLADRLLQQTKTISPTSRAQYLDDMSLERERGITIKLRTVRMNYVSPKTNQNYRLHMVDCPGHTDFAFEVGRSLAAVEGVLLLVDASQGVQAQTVANVMMAKEAGLSIIPVINKVDLLNADVERAKEEIGELLGGGDEEVECVLASAKLGKGIDEVLERVVRDIPEPKGDEGGPLQALIFDSYYDSYRGVVLYVRVVQGTLKVNDEVKALSCPEKSYEVLGLGCLAPQEKQLKELCAGDVGFVTAAIKSTSAAPVGDTITHCGFGKVEGERLPGYKPAKAVIYGGLYPVENGDFELVRSALEKLQLSDSALEFRVDTSSAMGMGFRVGYLGLLHADIVRERLKREFGVNTMSTAPSVRFEVCRVNGKDKMWEVISNPAEVPDEAMRIKEPFAGLEILTPEEFVGPLMELCQDRRGILMDMDYLGENRVTLKYDMPVMEIIADLNDVLKSKSRGYASMDYSLKDYRETDLVKLNILVAKEKVDPLAMIVSRKEVERRGRAVCLKLKSSIPRAQFVIAIQACVGSKVIASETISAQRKDVTAKCYGGDVSRKKKLLKKQAEGKKRMKSFGRIQLSQDVFMSLITAR